MTKRKPPKIPPDQEAELRSHLAAVDAIKAQFEQPHTPSRGLPPSARWSLERRAAFLQRDRDELLAERVELHGIIRKLLAANDELRANAAKGGAERRKYTDEDREEWKRRATELRESNGHRSTDSIAKQIAAEKNLPSAAVRTIRRVI